MRLCCRVTGLLVCACLLLATSSSSRAEDASESKRKMTTKIVPTYPMLAQKMGIAGSVKIEATVAPNGTVKATAILGGHPVLGQAAVEAVNKCKWEPASHETREVVILNFHPN